MTQSTLNAFDQAMSHAELAWGFLGAQTPSAEARGISLAIVARAISEEIKSGKPLTETYGHISLTQFLLAASAAQDFAVFDHLASDIADIFGAKRTSDLPENAGLHHTDAHASLTHSYWVLGTDVKKIIATAAKKIGTESRSSPSGSAPSEIFEAFASALSGVALYDQGRPLVPPRPAAAAQTAATDGVQASTPKKRPSM